MTGADRRDVDGGAWRAELERQHAHLANVVDQACAWAREFHVRTGDELWGESSSLVSYPLIGYADRLERISTALKILCANASLCPPPSPWDRSTMRAPSLIAVPGRNPSWRSADYSEGGQYVLMLQPTSPHGHIVTAREQWRAAIRLASPSVIERELGMPQLVKYAWVARSYFDRAHSLVHAAFRDSVAATFGRMWATWSDDDGSSRAAVLVSWMKALTDYGCSPEECEGVLRDIEVVDPEAVTYCRQAQSLWNPKMP